ncbi:MAG: alkylphosphonate ABC transporter permease [Lactococcus lactis]|jgi:hypothetical protein|nr:alkylphosphonate ABC transporter permease [Lactococcus lactis]MCI2139608.1 alkylphosphonate ABC transporter permease [Lactococcus lactis]MCI2189595.1 alkylphosphonate ABC transporter permease [Lactococcus lactis]
MNKDKSGKFVEGIIFLTLLSLITLLFLMLFYALAVNFNIKLPKEPAVATITQINFLDLLKLFLFVGVMYFVLFLLSGLPIALKVSFQGRPVGKWTPKELAFQETFGRILLGSYIPVVALFAFSKSQFSSLVDISALFAIFIFFFNFGKTSK